MPGTGALAHHNLTGSEVHKGDVLVSDGLVLTDPVRFAKRDSPEPVEVRPDGHIMARSLVARPAQTRSWSA